MPRWRQDSKTGKLIPIDEAAVKRDAGIAVHGDIQPFVSPIDGTVISDRKQYREHMQKHGVVPTAEFSQEFLDRKREERERHYGDGPPEEQRQKTRQFLYDQIIRAERNG